MKLVKYILLPIFFYSLLSIDYNSRTKQVHEPIDMPVIRESYPRIKDDFELFN